jgi:beta-phosphoglucomutase
VPDNYAVIWDVDGTLVDTAELHFQSWIELAKELDKPFSRADFAATFGQRNPEIIPRIFGIADAKRVDELGRRKEDLYRGAAKHGVALLPGAATLLEGLHRAGYRQSIGSSAPRENVDLILELTGIGGYLEAIVSMEDTHRGKPDPEVFLLAAGRVGVSPRRCLVMEDAPAGIQAAKAGGMKSIGITFVGHHSEAKLKEAGADLVVPSLEAVSVAKVRDILGVK